MLRALVAVVSFLAVGACATAAKSPGTPFTQEVEPAPRIQMVRETLRVSPLEMAFSGLRGLQQAPTAVAIKNVTTQSVRITQLRIVGPQADTFQIVDTPAMPLAIKANESLNFSVTFQPKTDAEAGVHVATLQILTGLGHDFGPPIDITGLVLAGLQEQNEPPLQHVVKSLGYAIDVGADTLSFGTDPKAMGEEISAPLFKAVEGHVALDPVARFSPDEPLPYGFFLAGQNGPDGTPALKQLGILAAGQHQTLNPGFQNGEGEISFDTGAEVFGLYVKSKTHVSYTDDTLNGTAAMIAPDKTRRRRGRKSKTAGDVATPPTHAARIYPLKSRNGAPIANAYLVAFEQAHNGDYQDYVFVLWNVHPVTAPSTP